MTKSYDSYLLSSKSRAEHSSAELIVKYICSGPNSVIGGTTPGTKKFGLISGYDELASLIPQSRSRYKSSNRTFDVCTHEATSEFSAGQTLGTIDSMQRCNMGKYSGVWFAITALPELLSTKLPRISEEAMNVRTILLNKFLQNKKEDFMREVLKN